MEDGAVTTEGKAYQKDRQTQPVTPFSRLFAPRENPAIRAVLDNLDPRKQLVGPWALSVWARCQDHDRSGALSELACLPCARHPVAIGGRACRPGEDLRFRGRGSRDQWAHAGRWHRQL